MLTSCLNRRQRKIEFREKKTKTKKSQKHKTNKDIELENIESSSSSSSLLESSFDRGKKVDRMMMTMMIRLIKVMMIVRYSWWL